MKENIGKIEATGTFGSLTLECRGPQAADNPKTSAVTAFSIVHAIENQTRTLII